MVPVPVGVTTIVTVALPLTAIIPRLPLTVDGPVATADPWDALTRTFVKRPNRESLKVTPVALLGPALRTITANVRSCPTFTKGAGLAVFVTEMSALGFAVIVAVAALFEGFGSTKVVITVGWLQIRAASTTQ